MRKQFLSFVLSFFLMANAFAQNIPLDPSVRTGTLSNGMKYYIKKNVKPEKKVEFRLAINAGSINEDEDQRGLAHFMEHMNFNGTKNFPENKLVDFLQSIGKTLGECGAIRFGRAFGLPVQRNPAAVGGEDGSEEEIRCWHLG